MNKNPLVSIIVITYNSSKYVLETLESAKAQTYKNIELIVSDDCSTDDTVEICKNWIEKNKDNFVTVKLLTTPENSGVSANCNRGIKIARGKLIKLIAADDLLLKQAIHNAVNYIDKNLSVQIFASKCRIFSGNSKDNYGKECGSEKKLIFNKNTSVKGQFKIMLKGNPIIAPTVFFTKQLWIENKGFDERIPNLEDYPFWIKTLQRGKRIHFMNKTTIKYRLHNNSLSEFESKKLFNNFYYKDLIFHKKYLKRHQSKLSWFNYKYVYYTKRIFDKLKLNHIKFKYLYFLITKLNILVYLENRLNARRL